MPREVTMDRAVLIATRQMVWEKMATIHQHQLELKEQMHREIDDELEDLREQLNNQIYNHPTVPLLLKTPKLRRKRIDTIPEDDVVNETSAPEVTETEEDIVPVRSRREASVRATQSIKKQQSMTLTTKLRRPSSTQPEPNDTRSSRAKRPMISMSDSEDENSRRPAKQSKMDKKESKRTTKPKIKEEPMSESSSPEKIPEKISINNDTVVIPTRESRRKSSVKSTANSPKSSVINNHTVTMNIDATVTEASMYEDALGTGKSIPMNSTMNPNTTITIDRKMLNVTVVLEKINDTTITKDSLSRPASGSLPRNSGKSSTGPVSSIFQTKSSLSNKLAALKETVKNSEFDELITDDESSMEMNDKKSLKKPEKLPPKRHHKIIESSDDSDDEVVVTPLKSRIKPPSKINSATKFKKNALFSPYAKASVKKRVEAFEQAQVSPPAEDIPQRITRTKTRAMATKEVEEVPKTPAKATVASKLARKSVSKAIKISLAKHRREVDDEKENTIINSAQKPSRYLNAEKTATKQQQRTTPVSKSRIQMPMSVNRIQNTPVNTHLLSASKAATATRARNLAASSTESLARPLTKSGSTDSLVEKKNKLMDEDARRKKEEALKAQSEEKRRRREEKELKNKLAREAREKLEQEKRLKLEKEKEERAKFAQLQQEKLREEAEKKKMAQLQRAQEKEERRRQEELAKQQRLAEQEETEKQLAERKRREQEAERRRQAELRAQQLAAAEAARLKQQYQAKMKMMQQQQAQQQQVPNSYKLDSEPDDDESDSEANPKHTIPPWAKPNMRRGQLEMQQYIPMSTVLSFFGAQKCTPDLSELFIGIKKDRLKRTSSAIWKTPPRFSMMEI